MSSLCLFVQGGLRAIAEQFCNGLFTFKTSCVYNFVCLFVAAAAAAFVLRGGENV